MTPLKPVDATARTFLGLAFFAVFVAVWAAATLGGMVSKTFLADPITMVRSGWTLMTEMGFAKDIAMTVWRSTFWCPPMMVSALRPLSVLAARFSSWRASASSESFCTYPLSAGDES